MVLEKNIITILSTKGKSPIITRVWKKDLDQFRSVSTKTYSHLRLVFSKYLAKPFLRSVRSKDVRG